MHKTVGLIFLIIVIIILFPIVIGMFFNNDDFTYWFYENDNYVYQLNGTGAHAIANNNVVYNVGTEDFYTIGMFNKLDTQNRNENMVNKYGDVIPAYRILISNATGLIAPNTLFVSMNDGTDQLELNSDVTIDNNTWYIYGVNLDAGNTLTIYLYNTVNGDLDIQSGSASAIGNLNNSLNFIVGARIQTLTTSSCECLLDNIIPPQVGDTITQSQFMEFADTGSISGLTPTNKYGFNTQTTNDDIGSIHLTNNGGTFFFIPRNDNSDTINAIYPLIVLIALVIFILIMLKVAMGYRD